ncbi:cobaltochelatase subunit CobN [Hyphomicrobium sp.]|uniref:cobaltochelatase subunit CobN n=1 Tax=Hyphomicrobium sp. TaxID=82 RepID=UPI002E33FA39|nr:cobaltochelatase subunit CobN [Hyphomicrobium sp.]HEX2841038.1 cobaltochelatase subunit CobN [Hyphomicrobium sp.]
MHVLATEALTLDETDVAIDLGQSPADVVLLSFSDSDLSAAAAAWKAGRAELPTLRLASLKRLRHPMSVDLYIDSVVAHAKAVVVRALGGLDAWRYGFERIATVAKQKGIVFVALPGCDRPDPRLMGFGTTPDEAAAFIDRAFRAGGSSNVGAALVRVASLIERAAPQREVLPIGAATAMRADGTAVACDEAAKEGDPRPSALIVFYRAQLLSADTKPVSELMGAIEREGLAPIAVAVSSLKDPDVAGDIERIIRDRRPSVILNATAFSATREDGTTVLDEANVPVLQVVLAGVSREAWAGSVRGLAPTDIAMHVVLPELDGRILTRAIAHKAETEQDKDLEYATVAFAPDSGRIAHVAKLARAWANLSLKAAAEKRVAVILSDYPARGGRTGYAVGLDTSESAAEILMLLEREGYATGKVDWQGGDVAPLLNGTARDVAVPVAQYEEWLSKLPEGVRTALADTWGAPTADPLVVNGAFSFPVVRAGNITVALQPERGRLEDRKQSYHDIASPPRHAYVAFYAWLREQERIDAMVHLGTHGTLEWLPGKALALSETCFPETVLGAVPVVYPFIVNNPGEAVQAKRRIGAVTIGHLTPPLSLAGLNGPLAELEGLIEEYSEADGVDRRRVTLLEAEIVERAWRSGLAADCGLSREDTPRAAVAKLDAQLCDIKELAVRDRLHVFGRAPDAAAHADLTSSIAAAANLAPADLVPLIAGSVACERTSFVAALAGKRVAPGPAGAPSRGRADVLPTGRNLTTIDPRAIPTRTAAIVGARSADEIVRRYLQDQGDYPKALVMDLWASASLRTGGDDLAQALAFLGVRPTWDTASQRVTGIEVIPEPKLARPRIDVTLRISGLFRDIFASQIALFEMAVGLVASLDEDDSWNPLAAARRAGESLDRIFGAAPGVYGAGAAHLALDGDWQQQSDIGEAYLASSSHAFGNHDRVTPAAGQFRERVRVSDALVHTQDDRERDILDTDDVADFVGGYAAAAALVGRKAALYHLDTSRPEAPRVRTVAEEVTRIVRGRLTNPRWISGMMRHGHRGVAEIAQGIDALYAFAATARLVPSHQFDAVHDAIFHDEATADAIAEANPAAAAAMAARLEEAIARGLWTPRRNAVGTELARMHSGKTRRGRVEAAQ